jgi:hypothetical protein
MRRLLLILIPLALAGATTVDMLDGPSPAGPPTSTSAGSNNDPNLLDGGVLRKPPPDVQASLDGRATPS